MIDKILSIKLTELKMVERSEKLQETKDNTSYVVGIKFILNNVAYNSKEDFYSAKTTLNLEILPEEDVNNENNSKDTHLTSAKFVHELSFKSNNYANDNDEFGHEINQILEPYYRELINSIYSKTEIDVPILPYGFLKSKEDD